MGLDLILATGSALVVMGLIFNMFALVSYTFHMDPDLAWIFGLLGTGLWLFAVALFYFFLADPLPRHGKRR